MKILNQRAWRWVRRVGLACLLVLLGALGVIWMMAHHRPDWYHPASLDESGLRRARSDATNTADDVSDLIVRGDAFDLTLVDRTVTEWIEAVVEGTPEGRASLPPEISDIAVVFNEDAIRVGALLTNDGQQAVVSLSLTATPSGDGRNVEVTVTGVHAGSLQLPRAALEKLLGPLLEEIAAVEPHEVRSPVESALRGVNSVDDLFDGVSVRNRFVWPNGDRLFRIESIKANRGQLELRIAPL